MIISHKYKFIFIKTRKTAGTAIEVYLSQLCSKDDILTPINPPVQGHHPRNYRGTWNPIPELLRNGGGEYRAVLRRLIKLQKFYNHIPAMDVQARISADIFNTYFKFCVERNPWEKTLSFYYMWKKREMTESSFDEFLKTTEIPVDYPLYSDTSGNIIVSKIIKYEDLNHSLADVFNSLGIPFSGVLDVHAKAEYRQGKEERKPYQSVYTDKQREIISQKFEAEIKKLGYTWETQ